MTNFVNGPASFDSFEELLDRTMEHNPTRSESSLRRGILHNAVQREDGSWVWRYARFRTEPGPTPDFTDWWEAVSRAHCPALARARPGLVRRGRRRRRRAAAPPAHRSGCGRGGGRAQHPGRSAPRAGGHLETLPLSRRADGQASGLAVAPRPEAARGHPHRGARLPGAVRLADHPCPRGQQPQLGVRLRVADLRRLRRLHVVAPRARGRRGTPPLSSADHPPGGSDPPPRQTPGSWGARRRRRPSSTPTTRTGGARPSGTRRGRARPPSTELTPYDETRRAVGPGVGGGLPGAGRRPDERSGGRARTSNIRLQRPTFCRLNYPGPRRNAR